MNYKLDIIQIIVAIAARVALGAVLSYPVMLLWNGCLVDAILVVAKITWLQSWGIAILCNFLFNSRVTTKE